MLEISTKIPLVESSIDPEFLSQKDEIEKIIADLKLPISAEQYWQEIIDGVQYIEFESYVSLVDRVLSENSEDEEIHCFYYDESRSGFDPERIPKNSNEFMIQLLQARIDSVGRKNKIVVRSHRDRKFTVYPERVYILDDALYSGTQMYESLKFLPEQIKVHVFVVAATKTGEQATKEAFSEFNLNGKLVYLERIRSLKDILSPEAVKILIEQKVRLHASYEEDFLTSDELEQFKDDFRKVYDEDSAVKSLTVTPFKLPDGKSVENELLKKISAVKGRAYIRPKNLF